MFLLCLIALKKVGQTDLKNKNKTRLHQSILLHAEDLTSGACFSKWEIWGHCPEVENKLFSLPSILRVGTQRSRLESGYGIPRISLELGRTGKRNFRSAQKLRKLGRVAGVYSSDHQNLFVRQAQSKGSHLVFTKTFRASVHMRQVCKHWFTSASQKWSKTLLCVERISCVEHHQLLPSPASNHGPGLSKVLNITSKTFLVGMEEKGKTFQEWGREAGPIWSSSDPIPHRP